MGAGGVTARDHICAERGLLRARYITVLTGAGPTAVYNWHCPGETVSKVRYFSWDAIRAHLGPGGCKALNLPDTAKEALERALVMLISGNVTVALKWQQCEHENPHVPNLLCTKKIGHVGHHQHVAADGAGPQWGPTLMSLRATTAKNVRANRAKAALLIEATKDPHQLEPDVPDPAYPGLPHLHPLSIYLGNPLKMTSDRLALYPEYSWRIPTPPIIKARPWKANRAVDQKGAAPEWWLGEYVEVPGQVAIRWSKILDKVERADVILPKPGQTNDAVTPADFDDEKKAAPPKEPPLPEPVIEIRRSPLLSPEAAPPPKPNQVLSCNVPECQHSVDWHDDQGCSFARGTIAACSCVQPAPTWVLDQRLKDARQQANG
jgi:hypothetical protein